MSSISWKPDTAIIKKMQMLDEMLDIESSYNASMVDCYKRAFALWRFLQKSLNLKDYNFNFDKNLIHYSFNFTMPENCIISKLSISISPDSNSGEHENGYPEIIEIAIMDGFSNLIMNEELGYDECINYFSSNKEVEDEIIRIINFKA